MENFIPGRNTFAMFVSTPMSDDSTGTPRTIVTRRGSHFIPQCRACQVPVSCTIGSEDTAIWGSIPQSPRARFLAEHSTVHRAKSSNQRPMERIPAASLSALQRGHAIRGYRGAELRELLSDGRGRRSAESGPPF